MRKLTLLCVFICATSFMYSQTKPAGPDANGYYHISTLDNLQWISLNSTSWTWKFELDNNIDASDTKNWNSGAGFLPIGKANNQFKGIFDGKGFAISNLYINRSTTDYVALFGFTDGATIKNVGLINCYIIGGKRYVAGLVAMQKNSAIISRCYSTGIIEGRDLASTRIDGELIGGENIGGLVGANMNNSQILNSYSSASVSANHSVGGLIGYTYNSTVKDSYSTGKATAIDVVKETTTFNGSYSGGLIGYNDGSSISNSYSTASVSGTIGIGGLVGVNMTSPTYTACFWDTETSGFTFSAGGTGKTTAAMKTKTTFPASWNFTTNWAMQDYFNKGYPYLKNIVPLGIITLNPVNSANNIAVSPIITLTFNKAITLAIDKSSGLRLYKSSDNSLVFTGEAANISVGSGDDSDVLTIDMTALNLIRNTEYYLIIDDDAIASLETGELYAGITAKQYAFTTIPDSREINIKYANNSIENNASIELGTPNSLPKQYTFTIENTGNAGLNISSIAISGANQDMFNITQNANTPVASGRTSDFIIEYAPTVSGTHSAIITVSNDDTNGDETNYAINIKAASFSEIDVEYNNISAASMSNIDITGIIPFNEKVVELTIKNTGTMDLNINDMSFSGAAASNFSILPNSVTVIPANGSKNISVRFYTEEAGNYSATLTIANDESINQDLINEQSYEINFNYEAKFKATTISDDKITFAASLPAEQAGKTVTEKGYQLAENYAMVTNLINLPDTNDSNSIVLNWDGFVFGNLYYVRWYVNYSDATTTYGPISSFIKHAGSAVIEIGAD